MIERTKVFGSRFHDFEPEPKEIFLKAGFIALVSVAVITATAVLVVYTIWYSGLNSLAVIGAVASLIMLAVVGLLIKGRYTVAIHTVFISGFICLWLGLFLKPVNPLLAKTDSIVFVIGLLSAMAISVFNTRRPIVIYFFINFIVFVLFNYHLKTHTEIPVKEILEYFLDNTIAMSFVFFVVISTVTINKKTFASLKDELVERKKAQKAQLESENRFEDHLNNTPVGAIFWDLDFRVTAWNPSAERIFGFTKAETLGKHVDELILPDDQKEHVDLVFKDLLSGRGGERSINENITREGKRIICDWYNSVFKDAQGQVVGAASLVNDITEKVKIQEMIIQSEKMMSVGGIAAGMAHEINNPLAGIIQSIQVVSKRLSKDSQTNREMAAKIGLSFSDIQDYVKKRGILKQLELISDTGFRMNSIIKNMLSFSQKSDKIRKPVQLSDLMEKTVSLAKNDYDVKKKYNFKTIEIIRKYESNLPLIWCEAGKIQQVLYNLFKNACDAMNIKTYTDESPGMTLRLKQGNKHVHIEIEDNGPGMDQDIVKHIFEPFFTTKNRQGTGLGLSISYYIIVDDHSGQMAVKSVPGKGTRFMIKLPFRSVNENKRTKPNRRGVKAAI